MTNVVNILKKSPFAQSISQLAQILTPKVLADEVGVSEDNTAFKDYQMRRWGKQRAR
jgi:hypothetical protein